MKKLYCLLLVAVFVLTATCAAMAEDSKQGPEIYVDYGLGGTFKFSESSMQLKKTDFGQSVIGVEYPVSKWKFGYEYAWADDFSVEPNYSASVKINGDSSLALLKVGYQVTNSKQFQLYVDGIYARNSTTLKYSSNKDTIDTNGLLIGPEVRYAFSEALEFRGFYGYGVAVSQTLTANGVDSDMNDESMTFFNLKLTYLFTDHWAASIGYRAKEITSTYSGIDCTDKQDMLTVGTVYKF